MRSEHIVKIWDLKLNHINLSYKRQLLESFQSTLSHLITTSVPRAMITRFFVEHGLFITIYIEQTDLGVGFHNLINNLKLLTFRITTFEWLLSMKSQLNMNFKGPQRFISKRKH